MAKGSRTQFAILHRMFQTTAAGNLDADQAVLVPHSSMSACHSESDYKPLNVNLPRDQKQQITILGLTTTRMKDMHKCGDGGGG